MLPWSYRNPVVPSSTNYASRPLQFHRHDAASAVLAILQNPHHILSSRNPAVPGKSRFPAIPADKSAQTLLNFSPESLLQYPELLLPWHSPTAPQCLACLLSVPAPPLTAPLSSVEYYRLVQLLQAADNYLKCAHPETRMLPEQMLPSADHIPCRIFAHLPVSD